jgi:sugar lactone lactonase YvrE
VLDKGAIVRKLEDGFFSISGAAVDAAGKLYFIDHHNQRIYGWSEAEGLTVERDNPLDPVNLAVDKSGNLIVISSAGPESTVYSFRPGSSAEELTVLAPQAAQSHGNAAVILPVNWWNNGEFKDQLNLDTMRFATLAEMFAADASTPKNHEYLSQDGSVFLPAGRVFQQGPANETSGWRFSDNIDTYGFIVAEPGQQVYVSSESEDITYSAKVKSDGTLAETKPFTQRGGESVAVDLHGNVYVANGQIFVYAPTGHQIAEIDVPERPLQLIFGGPGRRTLFILAHHALFAAQVR